MTVTVREASDVSKLRELIRSETNAKQRDRFRAVLLAILAIGTQSKAG